MYHIPIPGRIPICTIWIGQLPVWPFPQFQTSSCDCWSLFLLPYWSVSVNHVKTVRLALWYTKVGSMDRARSRKVVYLKVLQRNEKSDFFLCLLRFLSSDPVFGIIKILMTPDNVNQFNRQQLCWGFSHTISVCVTLIYVVTLIHVQFNYCSACYINWERFLKYV